MSEAEQARNLHGVLAAVEVVIEQDNRAVAILKPSQTAGRMISEILADLKARGSTAAMDDDFAKDIQERIDAQPIQISKNPSLNPLTNPPIPTPAAPIRFPH